MQDLLREEEFREVHHDPRESFKLFQRIAFGISILFSILLSILYFQGSLSEDTFFWISLLVVPVIITIVMFRSPKKNIGVSPKVKLQGILGLIIAYILPIMVTIVALNIYTRRSRLSFSDMFFVFILELIVSAVLFGVSAFAVFVMSSFRDRRRL
jgi:hypothetical protein